MSSSSTTGLCKSLNISLVNKDTEFNRVILTLQHVESNKKFQLRFKIYPDKDTSEKIIDELRKDCFITLSNPQECSKLLNIYTNRSI